MRAFALFSPEVPRRTPAFRPPVLFLEDAVCELCRLARQGYETCRKKETFGFLFGTLTDESRLVVRRAVYYRGGVKSRSGVVFPDWASIYRVIRRRRELSNRLRLRFLGNFHSHVEIGGWVLRGLSDDDRDSFRRDEQATLETVVFVWAGGKNDVEPSPRAIVAYEPQTGYNYRIRVYAKFANGIRLTRVKVIRSGVVIVY